MSKPSVTITLGRSGQVVKRGGSSMLKNARCAFPTRSTGKRTLEQRFQGQPGSSLLSSNKRLRGNGSQWSPVDVRGDDSGIAQNDLRWKILRKRLSNSVQNAVEEHRKTDQCEKLSKAIQQGNHEAKRRSLLRQIPSHEISDDFHNQVDLFRGSYSSQTINGSRAKSPNRYWEINTTLSSPRNFNEMWQVPLTRAAIDVSGTGWFFTNEVVDASGLTSSMYNTMKASPATARSVAQGGSTVGITQKDSHVVGEPLTVDSFLHSLCLGKYTIMFRAEEVDMAALKQMGDNDLKELGIPMGPRKKILLSLSTCKARTTLTSKIK